MRVRFCLLAALFLGLTANAQVAKSNVFLFEIRQPNDTTVQLTKPQWLTSFNETGYNNHPSFVNDVQLFISSQGPYESQPDVISLNLKDKTRSRVTDTPEGEYSPSAMLDYYNFSAVRMEFTRGDTLLRLWQFPLDRTSSGKPVFRDITNIGYYRWLNSRDVLLYLVGSPSQLARADIYSQQPQVIASNVGRCFRTDYGGAIYYVQKDDQNRLWKLMRYVNSYYSQNKAAEITTTLPGSEDFVILPDGSFLMGNGSSIYRFRPGKDTDWQRVIDLSGYNIRSVTRLEISPNQRQLAVVGS